MVRWLIGVLGTFGLIATWLHFWMSAASNRLTPAIRPTLAAKVFNEFGLGRVAMVKVSDASKLTIWLGDELCGKERIGNCPNSVACLMGANAVMTASFHWWTGKGFMVLGHVICDGESKNSPNLDILLRRRCYFATTWDMKFLIGETDLTAGKLLQKMSQIRHLVGGGGWLIKDGDPEAWRLAFKQGFRPDITCAERERTVVAIDKEGKTAWLAVFEGRVSLRETSWWLKRHLPIHRAIFFDGGRNSVLIVRTPEGELQTFGTTRPLPEVPCMIVVR